MDWINGDLPNIRVDFKKAVKPELKKIQDHPESLRAIQAIEEKRITTQIKYQKKCEERQAKWIQKEAIKIFDKHYSHNTYEHPKPEWGASITWTQCVEQATQNIHARINMSVEAIDWDARIKQRDIFDDISKKRRILKKEVREVKQSDNTKRIDVVRDFDANKSHYEDIARQNGSKNPKSDAYLEFQARLSDLTSQKKHQIQKVYENHGFNYHNEEQTLTKRFQMVSH